MKKAGGTKADLIFAFCRGQCILPKKSSVQMLREAPLLRALMVSAQSTVAARVIAEESKTDGGLNKILMARVNRVISNSNDKVCSDAEARVLGLNKDSSEEAENGCSQEGSLDGNEDLLLKELADKLGIDDAGSMSELKSLVSKSKEAKNAQHNMKKHLTKNARMAAKTAKEKGEVADQSEDVDEKEELSWEEKDIMRGLGIHDLQHVSSSVPVKEMVSRAAAKVCQVLMDIENHLRTKEGRPLRAEVDHLSRMAMNAVLDPRNEDCFKKSEAFNELFHVYAAKVISVKDVIGEVSSNGWADPMIAEWKRILIDFPCLEAVDAVPAGHNWVPLMWVLAQKKNALGQDSRKKARIVACQTLDKYWYEKDEKISPTVNPDAVKIMCALCLQLDMTMETRDQAGGYLHAEYPEDEEPVYVRVPDHLDSILKDHPELIAKSPNGKPARYFRVRRALYGCQNLANFSIVCSEISWLAMLKSWIKVVIVELVGANRRLIRVCSIGVLGRVSQSCVVM